MTTWIQLTTIVSENQVEPTQALLQEQGALSTTFADGADQPLFQLAPEETPLWQKTKIIALFEPETDFEKLNQLIGEFELTELEEKDWVHETQKNFPPQFFADKLWVLPSWCNSNNYSSPKIIIDPGLAFGTGTHPTTALCLKWLAQHDLRNQAVIDYGCGSGILALGALALGAKEVYATDHDPQALEATQNNAQLNHFKNLYLVKTEEMPSIKAPIIVANILSQALIELAPTLLGFAENETRFVLSGLLTQEVDSVLEAYSPYCHAINLLTQEEWACLILKPK